MQGLAQYRFARSLLFICALLLVLYPLAACKQKIAAKGEDAPRFSVTAPDGTSLKLSDLKGKVVLVNFWASWCPPCREENPSLNSLYNRLKDEPRFRYVSIIYRDDPGEARSYLAESGFSIPACIDPGGKAAESYGLTGVPETYIIDKKGILREKVIGPMMWDNPEVLAYLKSLILE
jgi:DsbE subfamily thiol:disulfide oxidoreductase